MGGLVAVFFQKELFTDSILSYKDLSRYFYPLRFFTVDTLKNGIIPLWNPYIYCGFPHLASMQSVVFYPLSIVYYLLPFDVAFNYFLVLHILLAGLFTYLLAKDWGYPLSASLVAAIVFMFSGYLIGAMSYATTLSSVIWFPLILLYFGKALDRRRPFIFLSIVTLWIMFLGGEPGIFYCTIWVLFFYALFRRGLRGNLLIFISIVISAVMLSSFQLLPFLELLGKADRTQFLSFSSVTTWSFPTKDIFNFFIPFMSGRDFTIEGFSREQNWLPVIYIGTLPFLLCIIAGFSRKDRRTKAMIFGTIASLVLAFGRFTPIYQLLYKTIPGLGLIRYPTRFLFISTFFISMLSGAGYNSCLRGFGKEDVKLFRRRTSYLLALLFVLSVLLLIFHLFQDSISLSMREFMVAPFGVMSENTQFDTLKIDLIAFQRFLFYLIIGLLLLYLRLEPVIRLGFFNFVFISLLFIDISSTRVLVFSTPSDLFHGAPPNVEFFMRDKGRFRVFSSPKARHATDFIKGPESYDEALLKAKDGFVANRMMEHGLYDANGYESIRLTKHLKLIRLIDRSGPRASNRLLSLLNVKYVITTDEIADDNYQLVNRNTPYCVYRNRNVLPRAFLATQPAFLENEDDILNKLASEDFNPSREVILEGGPAIIPGPRPTTYNIKDEKVEIVKYSPNEVMLEVATNTPKFLILSDQYYPGWKAYIDAKETRIYRADLVLRAVYLENPGVHVVRFLFVPFSFRIGATITIFTMIILMITYVYLGRRPFAKGRSSRLNPLGLSFHSLYDII